MEIIRRAENNEQIAFPITRNGNTLRHQTVSLKAKVSKKYLHLLSTSQAEEEYFDELIDLVFILEYIADAPSFIQIKIENQNGGDNARLLRLFHLMGTNKTVSCKFNINLLRPGNEKLYVGSRVDMSMQVGIRQNGVGGREIVAFLEGRTELSTFVSTTLANWNSAGTANVSFGITIGIPTIVNVAKNSPREKYREKPQMSEERSQRISGTIRSPAYPGVGRRLGCQVTAPTPVIPTAQSARGMSMARRGRIPVVRLVRLDGDPILGMDGSQNPVVRTPRRGRPIQTARRGRPFIPRS